MKARVFVTLKDGVFDPQGEAVRSGLAQLGFSEVEGVRIGKYIEVEVGEGLTREAAKARAEEMARKLLANTVIEKFAVEVA